MDQKVGVRRSEGYFKGALNFELAYQAWRPEKFHTTLVVTHGLGEHGEAYDRLAVAMCQFGIEVLSWDLRGHGRSEGKRGVVGAFTDFVDDLDCFVKVVRGQKSSSPIFLLGHSMGGLVTASYLIRKGWGDVKGTILSSPLVGIAVDVPWIKEAAGKMLGRWFPKLTLFNEVCYEDLTHDGSVIEEYKKDTLRHDRIATGLYLGMLDEMNYVLTNATSISGPIFLQQAGVDRIVSRPRALEFFNRVSSNDKELSVYEGLYHEIYNESQRETVFKDLSNWILSRTDGGPHV